jgi:addiction module HigA family antidote
MRVSPQKINDNVRGKRGITADTALRQSTALGTSAEFWMGLQSDYDLEMALDVLGDRLQKEITPINA